MWRKGKVIGADLGVPESVIHQSVDDVLSMQMCYSPFDVVFGGSP